MSFPIYERYRPLLIRRFVGDLPCFFLILLPFSDGHLMIKKGCLSCVGLFRFDDDDPEAELERIQEEETKDSDLVQGFFYGPRS